MNRFFKLGVNQLAVKPDCNPRPLSDAEIIRAKVARWLRKAHAAGVSIPELIDRIHDEPSESDWLPGDEPRPDRS